MPKRFTQPLPLLLRRNREQERQIFRLVGGVGGNIGMIITDERWDYSPREVVRGLIRQNRYR